MDHPECCHYHADFLSSHEQNTILTTLNNEFNLNQPDYVEIIGKGKQPVWPWKMMLVDPLLVDSDVFPAHHGRRQAWFPAISSLQQKLSEFTGIVFPVCVCIYYPDGDEYLDFHSDLPAFGPTNVIASISLGAERAFHIRHQSQQQHQWQISLASGSLLLMADGFQDHYQHAVPKATGKVGPRFNLTFRQFNWPGHVRSTQDISNSALP